MKILGLALAGALALTAFDAGAVAADRGRGGYDDGIRAAASSSHAWKCRNSPRYRARHDCGRHRGWNNNHRGGRYYQSRNRTVRVCKTYWRHGERHQSCRLVVRARTY